MVKVIQDQKSDVCFKTGRYLKKETSWLARLVVFFVSVYTQLVVKFCYLSGHVKAMDLL